MAPPHLPENVYLFGPAPLPAMLLLPTFNARLLPCSEAWAAMTPQAQGRHCVRCQRVVQDFSQSANPTADLAAARAAAPDGRVCGRFAGAQVQDPQPLTRRLRWFLVALVVAQGLSAREALAQVRQGAPLKTRLVKPVKPVELLGDVEALPSFHGGGNREIVDYIQRNLHYQPGFPEGRLFAKFTIDSTGRVLNPSIVKSLAPAADAEAIRVIKTLNGFTPGKQNGFPVNVEYTVPVTFKKP